MADIFISYSHSDVDFVRDMVPQLEREGFSVWWDHTIPPGKTWDDVIAKGIKDAKACIIVWSPQSVVSDWVKEEATLAKQVGKYLPVQVGTGEPPIGFRRIQAANLQTWNGNAKDPQWRLLITEAARMVKGEPADVSPEDAITKSLASRAGVTQAAVRSGVTLNRSVLVGLTVALVIVISGLVGGLLWWRAPGGSAASPSMSQTAAPTEPRGAGTVVGIWNGTWHYETDPPQTNNWMRGTFRADSTLLIETSAGARVSLWAQSGTDVRWAANGFNYLGIVTGNRLSGTFSSSERSGVFEATR